MIEDLQKFGWGRARLRSWGQVAAGASQAEVQSSWSFELGEVFTSLRETLLYFEGEHSTQHRAHYCIYLFPSANCWDNRIFTMATSSRHASPTKRLMTELQTYQNDPNDALLELGPADDDVLHWRAVMKGVVGTAYEGTFVQTPALATPFTALPVTSSSFLHNFNSVY
jgi:hypothetical protein